jgi:hypothetical protein
MGCVIGPNDPRAISIDELKKGLADGRFIKLTDEVFKSLVKSVIESEKDDDAKR